MKMLQATAQPDPRLPLLLRRCDQLLLDRFSHEDSQRDAPLRRNRLGPAENSIGNLDPKPKN